MEALAHLTTRRPTVGDLALSALPDAPTVAHVVHADPTRSARSGVANTLRRLADAVAPAPAARRGALCAD